MGELLLISLAQHGASLDVDLARIGFNIGQLNQIAEHQARFKATLTLRNARFTQGELVGLVDKNPGHVVFVA